MTTWTLKVVSTGPERRLRKINCAVPYQRFHLIAIGTSMPSKILERKKNEKMLFIRIECLK